MPLARFLYYSYQKNKPTNLGNVQTQHCSFEYRAALYTKVLLHCGHAGLSSQLSGYEPVLVRVGFVLEESDWDKIFSEHLCFLLSLSFS